MINNTIVNKNICTLKCNRNKKSYTNWGPVFTNHIN